MKQVPFIAGQIAEEQCALIKHFADGGTVKRMPAKLRHVPGVEWEIMGLDDNFNFDYFEYRIVKEEAKLKMRNIVVKAWFDGVGIFWRNEEPSNFNACVRVPKEDKVIEVPVQVFTTSIKGD